MRYVICAAFAVMCVLYLGFQRIKKAPGHRLGAEIALKCGATAMAALTALLGCLKSGTPAQWTMLAGLVICAVADGVLCVHFIGGGALFVLGHVLYMVAFCLMRGPDWRCAVAFLVLMGLFAAATARVRPGPGGRYGLIFAYAAILCLMVALACVQAPLFFVGAVLFAASDALLGCLSISRRKAWMDYLSLALYYLGQFAFGLAVFLR